MQKKLNNNETASKEKKTEKKITPKTESNY